MIQQLTELAHQEIRELLRQGDIAIDATAGNGHDTCFLASCVGPTGQVYAFDIQPSAIKATAEQLAERAIDHVTLLQHDHAGMTDKIVQHIGQIAAVMFNLGYLPGSDKQIKTQTATTLTALSQAMTLLKPGGIITIIGYTGHAGGEQETQAVQDCLKDLAMERISLKIIKAESKENPPVLFIVRKRFDD